MAETLKALPCPFCGCRPKIERGGPGDGPGDIVWCVFCERGDHVASIQSSGTRKQAIAAWNNWWSLDDGATLTIATRKGKR